MHQEEQGAYRQGYSTLFPARFVSKEACGKSTILAAIKKYLLVTKPGIVCGNLIAAAGAFVLASRGRPDPDLLAASCVGISLVVASGCVFNNWADRDLDRKMTRTRNRVLARGRMSPKAAVIYGSLLALAGFALLAAATNVLCVAMVLAGLAIYAGGYSLYLKRRSPFAVIIGSLAGAAPPVAAYCAAANRFDLGALLLLAIFTVWQIPHSHAIAVFRYDDYRSADLPVLPVKRGLPTTRKRILLSISAFTAVSLLPTIFGYTGYIYLAAAFALGSTWLCLAGAAFKAGREQLWAQRLFHFSIIAIIALSIMMAVDSGNHAATGIAGKAPFSQRSGARR